LKHQQDSLKGRNIYAIASAEVQETLLHAYKISTQCHGIVPPASLCLVQLTHLVQDCIKFMFAYSSVERPYRMK